MWREEEHLNAIKYAARDKVQANEKLCRRHMCLRVSIEEEKCRNQGFNEPLIAWRMAECMTRDKIIGSFTYPFLIITDKSCTRFDARWIFSIIQQAIYQIKSWSPPDDMTRQFKYQLEKEDAEFVFNEVLNKRFHIFLPYQVIKNLSPSYNWMISMTSNAKKTNLFTSI